MHEWEVERSALGFLSSRPEGEGAAEVDDPDL